MTTTSIISKEEYATMGIDGKVGTLMFGDDWYDVLSYVDTKKFRKSVELPKGSRIVKILVKTMSHPEFKNIANKSIPYRHPLVAYATDDGAFQRTDLEQLTLTDVSTWWFMNNPLGDAIVVVNKPKHYFIDENGVGYHAWEKK